jgi:hypothetical protein
MFMQPRYHLGVMFGAPAPCGWNNEGRQVQLACGSKAGSVLDVRQHNRDLRTGQTSFADRFGDRKKV